MLVLSRKLNQRIKIGDSVVLTVVKIQGNVVRLGIEAPRTSMSSATSCSRTIAWERPGRPEPGPPAVRAHGTEVAGSYLDVPTRNFTWLINREVTRWPPRRLRTTRSTT